MPDIRKEWWWLVAAPGELREAAKSLRGAGHPEMAKTIERIAQDLDRLAREMEVEQQAER